MPPLSIAVAQPPCVSYDVAGNALAHAAAVRGAGARVVVFPELSLTGYELSAPVVEVGDPRLAPIVSACADTGSLALVGAPVPGEHIAVLAVDGTGVTVAYRKMWLGTAEAARFAPGDRPVVLEVDGWRLGLAVCKDTGVAAHAAQTAALGMDAYVAGTVKSFAEAGLQDERALQVATRYAIAVAIASFAGPTGGGFTRTAGGSAIWSADGTVLARTGTDPGGIARATLS